MTTEIVAIFVIVGLAGLAIGWPSFRYRKTKRDGYLTMAIIHGVIAGFSALYCLLVVVTNSMLYIWAFPLLACAGIALIDLIRVWVFEKRKP